MLDPTQTNNNALSHTGDPDFSERMGEGYEFPQGADSPPSALSRRSMLQIMGASTLLATGVGCIRRPRRKIVSQTTMPEYMKPGIPVYYASTWTEGRVPYGTLVKCVDGRPIKIEGNPAHPLNKGKSDQLMQSSILGLYDPDRLKAPMKRTVNGETVTWKEMSWADADAEAVSKISVSDNLALVTRSNLGPSERDLVARFLRQVPEAKHVVWEAAHNENQRRAWKKVYGGDGEVVPKLDGAKVIVSFESDFLGVDGETITNSLGYAQSREVSPDKPELSRLWAFEGALSLTGASADQRVSVRSTQIPTLVQGVYDLLRGSSSAAEIAAAALNPNAANDETLGDNAEPLKAKIKALATQLDALIADLKAHPRESVVLAGAHQPQAVHELVAAINYAIQANGHTLFWNAQPACLPCNTASEVVAAIEAADMVVVLGANPAYDLPVDFAELVGGEYRKYWIGHGETMNETLEMCDLALPSAHNLESWNDASPRKGLWSVCQPTIDLSDLAQSRQEAESILAWCKGLPQAGADLAEIEDFHDYVRAYWKANVFATGRQASTFEDFWHGALHDGLVEREPENALTTPPTAEISARLPKIPAPQPHPLVDNKSYELVVRPNLNVGDGRFANRAWLQEASDPVTKVVWDNVAAISNETADAMRLAPRDRIGKLVDQVALLGRNVPAFRVTGIAPGVVALTLGHGRTACGSVGNGHGFNVTRMLASAQDDGYGDFIHLVGEASRDNPDGLVKHNKQYKIVTTQEQQMLYDDNIDIKKMMDGVDEVSEKERPIVLRANLEEYKRNSKFVKDRVHLPHKIEQPDGSGKDFAQIHSTFEPFYNDPKQFKWGMAIDLNKCTGCGACTVACQAENNIPVVGKTEVGRGREMHWIRIDKYVTPHDENGVDVHYMPVPCQHCEKAPCETVCPVAATTHSIEGINEMTYNRCVGTRYCANNCPYKVRRFNFYEWTKQAPQRQEGGRFSYPEQLQDMQYNPQVTVRGVGVMEKCTYCVQRVTQAKYDAQRSNAVDSHGKPVIEDGKLVSACQQACPSDAIVFGDMNDKDSRVHALLEGDKSERSYILLEELNNKPRTRYLARVLNPAPGTPQADWKQGPTHEHHGADSHDHHGDGHHNKNHDSHDDHKHPSDH